MKNKNIKLMFLILLSTFIFSGCGKNEETSINVNGEVDVSEQTSTEIQQEDSMPVYDYKNLPVSNELSGKEYESYYKGLLNERDTICYNEIYSAAEKYQEEIVLSKAITPESLKHIMNIIYLDTPELYMLETSYEYDTDTNGTVYKVYLKYALREENREELDRDILSRLVQEVSEIRNQLTEYDAELMIIEIIERYNYVNSDFEFDFEEFDGRNPQNSMASLIFKGKGNSIAQAKLFNYYCRNAGINSTIVIGEITDTSHTKKIGLELSTYKTPEEIYTETVDGSHIIVDVDYSGFYAWNIVNLNDKWYHVDILLPVFFHKYFDLERLELENMRTLMNVDDSTISQSRLFYVNEEILGLIPECNEKIFQSIYRQGNYMLNYNENQIITVINNKLLEITENKPEELIYQFGSEKTYNLFLKNFDSIVKSYNENNGNVIQNYVIVENKTTLSIIIKELLYY